MVFDKDFSHDADFRFPKGLVDGQVVKIVDNLQQIPTIFEKVTVGKLRFSTRHPFFIKSFRRAWLNLVRLYTIFHAHQQIAIDNSFDNIRVTAPSHDEIVRFALTPHKSKGRNLSVPGILQCLPHKVQIVCRAARAAGLEQHDCRFVRIASTGTKLGKHLSDDDNSRITHIVVHISKPDVDCLAIRCLRNNKTISVSPEHRF